MQAIKEKLSDINAMRKAKAEAKEEERAEKELAKVKGQVAYEVRMAREAEAAMDRHVSKAAEKAAEYERKHHHHHPAAATHDSGNARQDFYDAQAEDSYGGNPNSLSSEYSASPIRGGGAAEHSGRALEPAGAAYGREAGGVDSAASAAIMGYTGPAFGGPPTNNKLL
ncbi:hypothetical protein ACP275_14G163200 [Erythranthe tilingii]